MMKKLISGAAVIAASFAVTTGPVSAHVNDEVDRGSDTRLDQGAPFPGFVGPIPDTDGIRTPGEVPFSVYLQAHSGMECGALRSPNIAPLGAPFECPSAPDTE